MNAIFIYHQLIYTKIDLSNTIFRSLPSTLPNIFLTMIGTEKVIQGITASSALKENFPIWKYFMSEFDQYIAGNKWI